MITAIIPTYNGADLLRRFLPAMQKSLDGNRIIIIDDGSVDDTKIVLSELAPSAQVIIKQTNGGFSKAVNDGIRAASTDFILLLNTDVELPNGFLDPIMPLFEDENVFSVSPRIVLPNHGNLDEGCKMAFWYHGMFYLDQRQSVTKVVPTLYSTGCAAVYRRSMLEDLGGFGEVFSPFYWEDADLGYRAWKRGWKSLYQPAAVVYHQHAATISKNNSGYIDKIKTRNWFLFMWRNIDDQAMLKSHRLWLPLVLGKKAASCNSAFLQGWKEALKMKAEAARFREAERSARVMTDKEILLLCGDGC